MNATFMRYVAEYHQQELARRRGHRDWKQLFRH